MNEAGAACPDRPQLRAAIIELQEQERRLHQSRLPGDQVADVYLDFMLKQTQVEGVCLVAERNGEFCGFVAGWVENSDAIAETPDSRRFGYISDICVLPPFRGQGIAMRLLQEIELRLRRTGVSRLRINVLAVNTSARAAYERAGFAVYEIQYEKP